MDMPYASAALSAIHDTARGLAEIGLLDQQTMKVFDVICLNPVKTPTSAQSWQIRRRETMR